MLQPGRRVKPRRETLSLLGSTSPAVATFPASGSWRLPCRSPGVLVIGVGSHSICRCRIHLSSACRLSHRSVARHGVAVMDTRGDHDVRVRFLSDEGAEVRCGLDECDPARLASGRPVRIPRSFAGQRHYAGPFWSATNGNHVVYESLLELSWLWLADFDPAVARIAAQPFHLHGSGGSPSRYPDFLTLDKDGAVRVVDVKPASMLTKSEVKASLDWTGDLLRGRGWGYEVWSGPDPVVLRNVRLLGAARRASCIPGDRSGGGRSPVRPGALRRGPGAHAGVGGDPSPPVDRVSRSVGRGSALPDGCAVDGTDGPGGRVMIERGTVTVRPGSRLWFSGEVWTVVAVEGRGLTLTSDGRTMLADVSVVIDPAQILDGPGGRRGRSRADGFDRAGGLDRRRPSWGHRAGERHRGAAGVFWGLVRQARRGGGEVGRIGADLAAADQGLPGARCSGTHRLTRTQDRGPADRPALGSGLSDGSSFVHEHVDADPGCGD